MSDNETLRNFTSERAAQLSAVLKDVATTYKAKNFGLHYIKYDFQAVVDKWKKMGGETWQLIEPVDGFHPSQNAMYMASELLWQEISDSIPDVIKTWTNPNNARIKAIFGDQGEYSCGGLHPVTMLDVEVVPGRSLGSEQWEFVLGMTFTQAVNILRRQYRLIKDVQVIYCESMPLSMDLVLNLTQDGIKLIFDTFNHRLKIIEIYDLRKVKLKYCGKHFNSPLVLPTIEQIDSSFGATKPAVYDAAQQLFTINFRGLSFLFPIPADAKFEPPSVHGLGSIPLPSKTSVQVSKIYIYGGSHPTESKAPPIPSSCFCGNVFCENVETIEQDGVPMGLTFHLLVDASGQSRSPDAKRQAVVRTVTFGDSCQDVMGSLGAPNKIFFKSEDKMRIHSRSFHKDQPRTSDYFYNYFTVGVDILFDASTHCVKKFILHANYPGHYNFNIYHRCNFEILLPNTRFNREEDGYDQPLSITTFTKWDSVNHRLIRASQKPVVLNRASAMNTTNPFGSTFCYGVLNLIFEVMPNNHIASVTMYDPNVASMETLD
ncbi:phagosome assembly factor 1-like [Diadema antillarum]